MLMLMPARVEVITEPVSTKKVVVRGCSLSLLIKFLKNQRMNVLKRVTDELKWEEYVKKLRIYDAFFSEFLLLSACGCCGYVIPRQLL